MNKYNVFIHESKMQIKSTIIWSVSALSVIFMYMAFFPSFSNNAESMSLFFDNYPEELKQAFGISGIDLSTVAGYFALTFLFVQICLAIQSSNLGFSLLSLEERARTADFLITKPIKRHQIFFNKISAAILSILITDIVLWVSSYIIIEIFKGEKAYDKHIIQIMLFSVILFQLFFFSISLLVSMLLKKVKNVLPFSMGFALGMYVISAFGSIIGEKTLVYITPFKYFEPNYLVMNQKYDSTMILICITAIIISFVLSYLLYLKRNFHTAS